MSKNLIENVIHEKLTGETQKNALDLIAFMQENGFSFKDFASGNDIRWTPMYKGNGIGCIAVAEESMLNDSNNIAIWLGLECNFENDDTEDDELKEFAWSHIVNCPQELCKPPHCKGSKNRYKILGKEYESTCHAPLAFFELSDKSLENIKKLILMIK